MRVLVKVGGAQLSDPASRADLATAVRAAQADGHEIILVHGGGDQIRALTRRLDVPEQYHEGLRITDAATAQIALMVLGGEVNRWVVAAIGAAGGRAVGLTGADGSTFFAEPLTAAVDLGFVGVVGATDPRAVESLLAQGLVPVIATVAPLAPDAPGDHSQFYNINADHAAGPLARAFGADAVLFLTNVAGVLDADGTRIDQLTDADCASLRAAGVIRDGMIPKIDAALHAVHAHPKSRVVIAPASGRDAVRNAMRPGTGTVFATAAN